MVAVLRSAVSWILLSGLAFASDGWRLTWLELEVRLEPERRHMEIDGLATLELKKDSARRAGLFLNDGGAGLFRFLDGSSPGATVTLVHSPTTRPNRSFLHVEFEEELERGAEIEIEFRYAMTGQQGSQTQVRPNIALASWTEIWTPVPIPAEGERPTAAWAAAPGTTQVEMPVGWSSVTTGQLMERIESDEGVTEIFEDEAHVARSLAAAPYFVTVHELDGREVRVCRLKDDPSAAVQAEALAQALAAMEARFGPFPYSSCHLAEVPGGLATWYAASQQGFIMAQTAAFSYGANLPLFAHEASHGWWGNLVNTTGPGSILCSESLAQYGAVIAIETQEGEAALRNFLGHSRIGYVPNQCAKGYFDIVRRGKDIALAELSGQAEAHTLSDAKGHWMYHMLRHEVGDEVFFATLRGLIGAFAGKRMALDDVRAAFRKAAPDVDLETFFAQWLDRTGAPILDASFEQVGDEVKVVIEQAGTPFALNLEVAVEREAADGSEDGSTDRHLVELRGARHEVTLPAAGVVKAVHLDPDHHFLMWRPEYGERPDVEPVAAGGGE